MITKQLLTGLLLSVTATMANANVINFKQMGNISEHGTATLATPHMNITGRTSAGKRAFAYLDSGWGGLGVCKVLDADNQCNPTSDDNATLNEILNFKATAGITITKIWFNNNHDGDLRLDGDTININGVDKTFSLADRTDISGFRSNWLWTGLIGLNTGDDFDISYVNEGFYVSKMEYLVPEPAMLSLLALGLIGIGASKRRKA